MHDILPDLAINILFYCNNKKTTEAIIASQMQHIIAVDVMESLNFFATIKCLCHSQVRVLSLLQRGSIIAHMEI